MSKIVSFRRIAVILLAALLILPVSGMNAAMAKSVPVRPIKIGKPTSVKVVVSNSSIKISWKKVKNAKKYEIYRTDNKRGKYARIKTTSKRTYTDRKGKADKTYYYKVRAYRVSKGKKSYGAFSKVKSATMPKKTPSNPTPVKVHTVTFLSDGLVLKTQQVEHGKAAIAPEVPIKTGYAFVGWDSGFSCVMSDLAINARWRLEPNGEEETDPPVILYTVTFISDGIVLKTQQVESGQAATAPEVPTKAGYVFVGWDQTLDGVSGDLVVNAKWEDSNMLAFEEIKKEFLKDLNDYYIHQYALEDLDLQYLDTYRNGVAMVVKEPSLYGLEVSFFTIGEYWFYMGNPVMILYVFETSTFLRVHFHNKSELLSLLSQEELCDLSSHANGIWPRWPPVGTN